MKIKKIKNYFYIVLVVIFVLFFAKSVYATLTCSVKTAGACSDIVMFRMSGSSNAHAELPGQTTSVYDNNVVCCSGVTGLGNSCSGNYKVLMRMSGVTNAHVEENTQTNVNYTQNACISSIFGDTITVGYQASNCNGYDTTIASMERSPTNSQIGNTSAYNNKICADIFSQSITFNVSDSSIGFGSLTPTGIRYATGDGIGSDSETESYNVSASTNAPYGYLIYLQGDSLSNGISTIDPMGGTNIPPASGSEGFGMRAVASGGTGTVVSPYDGSGFAYDASSTSSTVVAEETTGDDITTTYSIRTVATIDSLLDPGNYTTNLTYVIVAGF
ncbi:MAG TPA: hypothetical protein PKZ36_00465 [Candidatus Paceibacterota bacterium]|nr:hypothetical protein [Candidatus Paceibacterota bacterium]HPT17872.1 hypothetical protein [Candidatus Paceibacterota bacterium]